MGALPRSAYEVTHESAGIPGASCSVYASTEAIACGGGEPYYIIPLAVLKAWPSVAASLIGGVPLSLWWERRLHGKVIRGLRDGLCIKDSHRIVRLGRIQMLCAVILFAAASPTLIRWFGDALLPVFPDFISQAAAVYRDIEMFPEEIAQQWVLEEHSQPLVPVH